MAQNELFKRYLDAGIQFSQMTQQRAEALVRDLVKAGEVQAEQTQALVNELVDRSRRNTERLVEQIRSEVRNQLEIAEVVTKDVVARMQTQIDDLRSQLAGQRPGGKKKPPEKKKAAAKKKAAKKKAPAKKKAAAKKKAMPPITDAP
jgi:polyhydroxyalkanoate synthesis regulator phasin